MGMNLHLAVISLGQWPKTTKEAGCLIPLQINSMRFIPYSLDCGTIMLPLQGRNQI